MPRRRRPSPAPLVDPFAVLGLTGSATLDEVDAARRALAKSAHPDIGGSLDRMQLVNAAADEASRRIQARLVPTMPAPATAPPTRSPLRERIGRRDHPSFTIEAQPAEAFEALLLVATWLGELIDHDPPVALEVELADPIAAWCRLDLVADAGSSTVSLVVVSEPGRPAPDLDTVRDAWVSGLNQLDWGDLGGSPPPP